MLKKLSLSLFTCCLAVASMAQTTFTFSTSQRGPVIGPLHYGIFYEEINHAGDGGLYAELIRNGSWKRIVVEDEIAKTPHLKHTYVCWPTHIGSLAYTHRLVGLHT